MILLVKKSNIQFIYIIIEIKYIKYTPTELKRKANYVWEVKDLLVAGTLTFL